MHYNKKPTLNANFNYSFLITPVTDIFKLPSCLCCFIIENFFISANTEAKFKITKSHDGDIFNSFQSLLSYGFTEYKIGSDIFKLFSSINFDIAAEEIYFKTSDEFTLFRNSNSFQVRFGELKHYPVNTLKSVYDLNDALAIILYVELANKTIFETEIDSLRRYSGHVEKYDYFKDFERYVIEKSLSNLKERIGIDIKLEGIKEARFVVAFRFTKIPTADIYDIPKDSHSPQDKIAS